MALAEQANLVVGLSLKDGISGALKGIQSNLGGLSTATSRTQTSLVKLGSNVVKAGIIGVGAVVGGLAAGFAVSIRAAADFEGQLNTINTVAKLSADDLTAVGDSLRKLAIDTGKPVEELTTAYYDLVSAGVDAADAQEVLTRATTLAIGGLGTTQETVNLLTTAMNAYGMTAEEVSDATDMFAQAIGAGKVTASELAESFATIGPVAASAGVDLEEVAAAYAQMTASGVPAAEAATAMRSAITALQAPNEALLKLQDKLNINFADVAEEEGLATAYQMIRDAADDQGVSLMTLTGNVNANAYALAVSGENAEGFAENLDAVRSSTDGAGVAAEQAAERQKGFSFQLDKLKVIGHDVAIMFGERMLPSLTRVVTKLGELIELNYPKLKRLADKIGVAFDEVFSDKNLTDGIDKISTKVGELIDSLGGIKEGDISGALHDVFGFLRDLPWDTIAGGMKITGEAAKIALDTFRSLPPDVQKGLITLLAANKLGGGIVTSVFKDLAGIVLRSLTTINAVNVTVTGANVISPGGGPPGVPPVVGAAPMMGLIPSAGLVVAGAVTAGVVATGIYEQLRFANVGSDAEKELIRQIDIKQGELTNLQRYANSQTGTQQDRLKGQIDVLTGQLTLLRSGSNIPAITFALQTVHLDTALAAARLQSGNTLSQTATSQLADIRASSLEQKGLGLHANQIAYDANERLSAIQHSSATTANKDFSVDVTVKSTLNVSAREVAAAVNHYRVLHGALEY